MARVHRRRPPQRPPLNVAQILAWADGHHRETGAWPTAQSGSLRAAPGETWAGLDRALYRGLRGLRGDSSLRQLLRQHGRVHTRRSNAWTAAEDALLGTAPDAALAPQLGRTAAAVAQRRRRLGIQPCRR